MRKSGNTWVKPRCGTDGIDELQRRARRLKPEAVMWKGDPQLPEEQQGVRVLGVPIGRGEFVRVFLEKKNKDYETLFQRIPWLNDPSVCVAAPSHVRVDPSKRLVEISAP